MKAHVPCEVCGQPARNFCVACGLAQSCCPPEVLARVQDDPQRIAFLAEYQAGQERKVGEDVDGGSIFGTTVQLTEVPDGSKED